MKLVVTTHNSTKEVDVSEKIAFVKGAVSYGMSFIPKVKLQFGEPKPKDKKEGGLADRIRKHMES